MMTEDDLKFYRGSISIRNNALKEAHDALRPNASDRERNNARAEIAQMFPELQEGAE